MAELPGSRDRAVRNQCTEIAPGNRDARPVVSSAIDNGSIKTKSATKGEGAASAGLWSQANTTKLADNESR